MRHWMLGTATAAMLLAGSGPAFAQDPGAGGEQQLQRLIEDVRELLDRAERERTADPWLIRDLRAVLDKYDWPWTKDIYAQDFTRPADGLPEPWRVVTGAFKVDRTLGLRTVVPRTEPRAAQQEPPQEKAEQPQERGTRMRELLGQMLEEAVRPEGGQAESQQQQGQQAPAAEPAQGRAVAPLDITNAFALRVEFSVRAVSGTGGGFAIGPYQGEEGEAGYRLIYHPEPRGEAPAFELVKRSPRGTESTVEFHRGEVAIEDGASHAILWTRDRDGRMQIDLDGQTLIEATDRGFADPFRGLAMVNTGGDYAVRSLVVKGTP